MRGSLPRLLERRREPSSARPRHEPGGGPKVYRAIRRSASGSRRDRHGVSFGAFADRPSHRRPRVPKDPRGTPRLRVRAGGGTLPRLVGFGPSPYPTGNCGALAARRSFSVRTWSRMAERTRTSTPALSRWPDVADEPNPFRGSRFRSQGKAWARQISRPRSRMFELRPSHLTRPERGWRACPFFLSILLRLQGWCWAQRQFNPIRSPVGGRGTHP